MTTALVIAQLHMALQNFSADHPPHVARSGRTSSWPDTAPTCALTNASPVVRLLDYIMITLNAAARSKTIEVLPPHTLALVGKLRPLARGEMDHEGPGLDAIAEAWGTTHDGLLAAALEALGKDIETHVTEADFEAATDRVRQRTRKLVALAAAPETRLTAAPAAEAVQEALTAAPAAEALTAAPAAEAMQDLRQIAETIAAARARFHARLAAALAAPIDPAIDAATAADVASAAAVERATCPEQTKAAYARAAVDNRRAALKRRIGALQAELKRTDEAAHAFHALDLPCAALERDVDALNAANAKRARSGLSALYAETRGYAHGL